MKFGCCTSYKNYKDVENMGYDYIELSGHEISSLSDSEFHEVTVALQNGSIPCMGFNDYCKEAPVMVGINFDPDAIRTYGKKLFSRGSRIGIKTVGIGAPSLRKLPPDFPMDIAKKQCIEFLRILLDEASPYGITILFESIHKHMCDYCHTLSHAYEIVREIDHPHLRLVADFYHMNIMDEPPSKIADYASDIVHTHISGCGKNYTRPYLTDADIPFVQEVITAIETINPDLTLSVECGSEDFLKDASSTLELLHHCISK